MPKRSISKSSPSAASANEETFDSLAMLDDARGDAASLPTPRQSKRGKTAQRPTPKSEEDGDVADVKHEDLLQALLGGAAISSVVDPILGLYRQQPNEALCVVINLIARASGVNEVEVDAKTLVEGMDVTPLLEELYARVPENSEAYFLVNKEAKYRRFKRSFPDFFTFLMQIAFSADVLLDTVFLPFLLQWLILMSESKSRSFRHTATVALLGIEQGLNRIASDLAQNLSTVRSARDVKVLQKQHHDIVEWRDHIFSQALHQRLRDVAPEIRLGVFQWLKQWVLEFPDDFVENKFLRYFGMALHDKKPEIRMEALDMILLGLARIPDAYNRFHLFLQYFVKRLVEMSGDVDLRCAEMAIRVVALMVRGDHEASEGNELLTDEMVDQVLLSFMDERPTIRTAVGVLFKVFVQCRVTGEDESNQVRASTELLLSFAGTLREQYGEQMPEKYVVDALWSGGKFPAMLSEFHGIIASVESNSPTEVAVALHVVAAMLAKLRNQLVLGPVPKEDRRANASTVRKPTSVEANAASELHQAISKDIGRILAEVLEKHAGEAQVLAAAANTAAFLDLSIFTTQRQTAQLSAIMVALRKWLCTAALATGDSSNETSNALIAAWHALASTEHPLKSEAQAHLAEAVQQVWKQVVAAEKGSSGRSASEEMVARAWERMRILSAVVHFDSHWNNIMDAWHRHADGSTQRPDVMGCIVATAVHTFLWQVGAAAPTMGETPIWPEALLSRGKTLITSTLQLLESTTTAVIERSGTATCWMHLDAFTYLCDLCALRCYDLSQREQELLVSLFEELFRSLGSQLVALQGDLKAITAASGDAASDIAAASSRLGTQRGAYRRVEAIQMRMITGMARLFLLKRMDVAMAPSVLFQWAFTTSKPVSDMFKNCFHSLRERAQDSFGLERDIIVHGYHRCVQVGATPASVEALTFIGNKLSSLHFAATDRYATTTESMVSFGVQFACTTDPLILQAITPYCPRLRMHEAQKIFQQEVRTKELFVNESSAYARAFLTFLRRAAKMEEDGSPASSSRKRGRTISGTVDDVSDDLLSSITNTVPADVAAVWQPSRDSTTTLGKASTRVTSSEGWRVHADEHPAPTVDVHSSSVTPSVSQPTVAKKPRTGATVVSVPSTQESASTVDGLDNEVFIATQEYE